MTETEKIGVVVKETGDRRFYNEGRNYQMGFMFARPLEDGTFETVNALSACREYLNEIVYAEKFNVSLGVTHGMNYKPSGLFKDQPFTYLAIKIVKYFGNCLLSDADYESHVYSRNKWLTDRANLKANIGNIEKLINYVEDQIGMPDNTLNRTEIVTASNDENMFLVRVPITWTTGQNLISLYSLLLRMGQFWNPEKMTEEEFLESYDNPLDKNIWLGGYYESPNAAKEKYKYLAKHKNLLSSFYKIDSTRDLYSQRNLIHEYGILKWELPDEEVEVQTSPKIGNTIEI